MKTLKKLAVVLAATTALAGGVAQADGLKVGMITTLSGGGAGLGIDVRDGFLLALKMAEANGRDTTRQRGDHANLQPVGLRHTTGQRRGCSQNNSQLF